MLDAYPDSPKCEDNYRNLPLHVAVQNGAAFAVIQMLLEAHPEGVRHNNSGKKQPLALATDDDVKELLAAKKKEIEEREASRRTPSRAALTPPNTEPQRELVRAPDASLSQGVRPRGAGDPPGEKICASFGMPKV